MTNKLQLGLNYFIPTHIQRVDEDYRRAQILIGASWVVIIFVFSQSPFYVWIGYWFGLAVFAYGGVSAILLLLLFKRFPKLVFWGNFFSFTSWAFFMGLILTSGGVYAPMVSWLLTVPASAFLMANMRSGWVWFGIAVSSILTMIGLEAANASPPLLFPQEGVLVVHVMASLGLIVYITVIIRLYEAGYQRRLAEVDASHRETARQKTIIETQNNTLSITLKELTESIHYAEQIQKALLGTEEELKANFSDSFVLFKPKDIVSGDFYWYAEVKEGDITHQLVAAGDCTGHGIPGAFMTLLSVSLLNELVAREQYKRPGKIITLLHKRILQAMQRNNREGMSDGLDIGLVAIAEGKIQFSGAKRPLYMHTQGESEIKQINATRFSVGSHAMAKEQEFENLTLPLLPNTRFFMFSDGFPDQFGGEKNKKYKIKNFRNLILHTAQLPMQEQGIRLEEELSVWQGENPQTDDIIVLGFIP